MKHDRTNHPEIRRRANPNGGESGCGCHPTEGGKPSALGKSRWKRRDARNERRVGKTDLKQMSDIEDAPILKVPDFSKRRPNRKVRRRS